MTSPAPATTFKADLTWATMALPRDTAHDEAQLLVACMNNALPALYLIEISGERSSIHMFAVRPQRQSPDAFRRTIHARTIDAFLELERGFRGRNGDLGRSEALK